MVTPTQQVEESRLRGDGSKVVTKHGRQSLARVSALDGRRSGSEASALVIMDDYVVQSEPVVDHLTRFSGITAGAATQSSIPSIPSTPSTPSIPSIPSILKNPHFRNLSFIFFLLKYMI